MGTCRLLRVIKLDTRPGWDVLCQLEDGERSEVVIFYWPDKEQPTKVTLASKFEFFVDDFVLNVPKEPDVLIPKRELEQLLMEKGFLKADQTLEDLKSLEDLIAG